VGPEAALEDGIDQGGATVRPGRDEMDRRPDQRRADGAALDVAADGVSGRKPSSRDRSPT
jgi:hypothetical protein